MTQVASSPSSARSAAGLEGVVAAPSEICFIDGVNGRLVYRGYEIGDLVENATFGEVAFLLWEGRLPNRKELETAKSQLGASMTLPKHVMSVIQSMPAKTQPMDALRTAASALSALDPDLTSNEPDA